MATKKTKRRQTARELKTLIAGLERCLRVIATIAASAVR